MTCCNKNCNQGRDCPARQACEMPIDMAEPDSWLDDFVKAGAWPLVGLFALLVFSFVAGYWVG